jgi:hypothetical protein
MSASPEQATVAGRHSPLSWPWLPIIAAIYPLWSIYLHNIGQVSISSVVSSSAVALAVVAVLYVVAMRWRGSRSFAALSVTVIVAAFYFYGPLHERLQVLASRTDAASWLAGFAGTLASHAVFSALLLVAIALAIWKLLRRQDADSSRLMGACNLTAAVLAFFLAWRVGSAVAHTDTRVALAEPPGVNAGTATSSLGYNPDIYYIILDGYARADVLREYYGFDNSEFLGELKKRGLSVNDSSRANYYWTFLSLASSLNYDYLQAFAAPILSDPKATAGRTGFGLVANLLQDNRAAKFLRSRGYRFVHLQSSAPETVRNPFADEQIGCSGRLFDDEYFRALAEVSWLKALGSFATSDLAECHILRLKSLGDQAGRSGPKFVFAHFLPPHHPYLFDHEGKVLKRVTISNQFNFQAKLWEDKPAYIEQLRYMNRELLAVLDRIVAESERPPIIIVQSDHGPNLSQGLTRDQSIELRFANFAAYLLPGAANGTIPSDCAPVNQFRYLFNHYFEAGLPILPNRSYVSKFESPLRMQEFVPVRTAQEIQ